MICQPGSLNNFKMDVKCGIFCNLSFNCFCHFESWSWNNQQKNRGCCRFQVAVCFLRLETTKMIAFCTYVLPHQQILDRMCMLPSWESPWQMVTQKLFWTSPKLLGTCTWWVGISNFSWLQMCEVQFLVPSTPIKLARELVQGVESPSTKVPKNSRRSIWWFQRSFMFAPKIRKMFDFGSNLTNQFSTFLGPNTRCNWFSHPLNLFVWYFDRVPHPSTSPWSVETENLTASNLRFDHFELE